jgi:hypothetical protein
MLTFTHQPNAPHRAEVSEVSKMLPVCAAKASATS